MLTFGVGLVWGWYLAAALVDALAWLEARAYPARIECTCADWFYEPVQPWTHWRCRSCGHCLPNAAVASAWVASVTAARRRFLS